MPRRNIAVLFGSASPEYEVSLKSAYHVITHLAKYHPLLIGINKSGEWFHFTGSPEMLLDNTWQNPFDCNKAVISPDCRTRGVLIFKQGFIETIRLDAALPVIHGKNGEDGTIQGLLELAGIPIIGSGSLASALCMDKDKAHKIVEAAGVRVPRSFVVNTQTPLETSLLKAMQIRYPLFVKPLRAGSSIGITKAFNQDCLKEAIELALSFDDEAIIEETIEGFEVGSAILEAGNKILIGEVDEVELAGGFFDYEEKYTLKTSRIHVPARISTKKAQEIKEAAKTIYRALGCSGFARVDMFLTPDETIVFNEVNTIPGFTQHSRYPRILNAAGITFEQLVSTLVENAAQTRQRDLRERVPAYA